MSDTSRDPHADNALIDELAEEATPSHSGASGGTLQRSLANRDELQTAEGADPTPTSVHKSDKANDGDEPNLPNRDGGGDAGGRSGPEPRRA